MTAEPASPARVPPATPARPVHLLAADPLGQAVLLEAAPDGAFRLPLLGTMGEYEDLPPIAALVAGYLGAAQPILRVLEAGEDAAGDATDILVVVEPVQGPAPAAARWTPTGDPVLQGLGADGAVGPHVARWLHELATGDIDPRRQRWEYPGFEERARAWMRCRLEEAGTPALAEPFVERVWCISGMLRARTATGGALLKACARVFDGEPAVTAALHRAVPGAVPEVIATDAAEGWLLMRDAGGGLVGEQPREQWHVGLEALAAIQQATADRLDGVSLEDRTPAALAAALPALFDGPFVAGFPDDIRPRFIAAGPRLAEACARLASMGPRPTLMHGDFHPWNALQAGDRIVIIDWSDAATGHPFTDLATWLNRTDASARRPMLDAWLAAWAGVGPRADLEEAALLALAVGALHQVESYRRIIESLEPGSRETLSGGGASYARWALAWLDDGLDASVPRRH
jgi:hypothetical protein